ncbi:MAG TPA: DUF4190 domain-containing protein [Pseudoxanthomonas sp.]|jgi:hypothetical protein|nr:DUF4190 domain-containing protein [Pseudoxanthomonas sp.]
MSHVRQTSTLAVVSLVSGILGWTLLPLIGTIAAIITGHMARGEIRRMPDRLEGDGMALAGLILGWVAVAAWALGLVLVFALFGGLFWLGNQ